MHEYFHFLSLAGHYFNLDFFSPKDNVVQDVTIFRKKMITSVQHHLWLSKPIPLVFLFLYFGARNYARSLRIRRSL